MLFLYTIYIFIYMKVNLYITIINAFDLYFFLFEFIFYITHFVEEICVLYLNLLRSKTMDGTILSWKEAIETGKSGYHVENYMKFAPASGSGNPIHFCVEFTEKDLKRDSGCCLHCCFWNPI